MGYVATQCPANALAVTEETSDQSMLSSGIVEGQQVDDILLDTGCSRTLVHQRLIPSMRYLPECRSFQLHTAGTGCLNSIERHGINVLEIHTSSQAI